MARAGPKAVFGGYGDLANLLSPASRMGGGMRSGIRRPETVRAFRADGSADTARFPASHAASRQVELLAPRRKSMRTWQRRMIGILTLAGSGAGLAAVLQTMFGERSTISALIVYVAALSVYVIGIIAGVSILEGSRKFHSLAVLFWALQIPFLASPCRRLVFPLLSAAGRTGRARRKSRGDLCSPLVVEDPD